jgi:hypothetical protein
VATFATSALTVQLSCSSSEFHSSHHLQSLIVQIILFTSLKFASCPWPSTPAQHHRPVTSDASFAYFILTCGVRVLLHSRSLAARPCRRYAPSIRSGSFPQCNAYGHQQHPQRALARVQEPAPSTCLSWLTLTFGIRRSIHLRLLMPRHPQRCWSSPSSPQFAFGDSP